MPAHTRRSALLLLAALPAGLAACGRREDRAERRAPLSTGGSAELSALIQKYADHHDVPVDLVHKVVQRESNYNPAARNGPYYGLMQILPQTARTMGYRGAPEGLLDAETNLMWAVKYLRGAWLLSNGNHATAIMWYARGYYYEAKRRGMLEETGLR